MAECMRYHAKAVYSAMIGDGQVRLVIVGALVVAGFLSGCGGAEVEELAEGESSQMLSSAATTEEPSCRPGESALVAFACYYCDAKPTGHEGVMTYLRCKPPNGQPYNGGIIEIDCITRCDF